MTAASELAGSEEQFPEVTRCVRALVAELSPIRREVHLHTRLIQDLGYDSLLIVELVAAVEQEFLVAAPDDADSLDIETVHDLVAQISALMAAGADDVA